MSRSRGSIIWFSLSKGFGYIRRTDGPDVFCHRGALRNEDSSRLQDGVEVEFDVTGPDGCHADNVVLLKT